MVQEIGNKVYKAVQKTVQPELGEPLTPLQRLIGFVRFVVQRFFATRGLQVAGSLTFTTLLALIPLITIALTVLTTLPGFGQWLPRVREFLLANFLPDTASKIIAMYMTHFSSNAGQLRLAGSVLLIMAALSSLMTVDRVFGDIWRIRVRRTWGHRILTYASFLFVGPIVVTLALTVTTSVFKAWMGYSGHTLSAATRFILEITPWGAVSLTLAAIYRFLPFPHVPFKHALGGGFVAGLGFELMRWLFSFYLHHFRGYAAVYGAFAAFPIFLMWIYLCWSIVISGAVLTASFSYWRGDAWRVPREHPDQQFRDALRVLIVLMKEGHQSVSMRTLQHSLEMGYDSLETAILPLVQAGFVAEDRFRACQALPKAWQANVKDIWNLFHRGPLSGGHFSGDQALKAIVHRLDELASQALSIPVQSLIPEE